MKNITTLIITSILIGCLQADAQAYFSVNDFLTFYKQPDKNTALSWLKVRGFYRMIKNDTKDEYFVYPSQYDTRHDYGEATVIVENYFPNIMESCRSISYYNTFLNYDVLLFNEALKAGFKKTAMSDDFALLQRNTMKLIIRRTTIRARNLTEIPIIFVRLYDENHNAWD